MDVPKRIYKCENCNKCYKRQRSYVKHSLLCDMIHNTQQENDNLLKRIDEDNEEKEEMPSMHELFTIVKELTYKYDKLQKDYDELKQHIGRQKKKINIIDYLNKNFADSCEFTEWENSLTITFDNLDILFKSGYVECFTAVIGEKINKQSPIKCFNIKDSTFYIYKNSRWVMLCKEDFTKIIRTLHKRVFKIYKEWCDLNKVKINNGTIDGDDCLQKICGFIEKEQSIISSINTKLYAKHRELLDENVGC